MVLLIAVGLNGCTFLQGSNLNEGGPITTSSIIKNQSYEKALACSRGSVQNVFEYKWRNDGLGTSRFEVSHYSVTSPFTIFTIASNFMGSQTAVSVEEISGGPALSSASYSNAGMDDYILSFDQSTKVANEGDRYKLSASTQLVVDFNQGSGPYTYSSHDESFEVTLQLPQDLFRYASGVVRPVDSSVDVCPPYTQVAYNFENHNQLLLFSYVSPSAEFFEAMSSSGPTAHYSRDLRITLKNASGLMVFDSLTGTPTYNTGSAIEFDFSIFPDGVYQLDVESKVTVDQGSGPLSGVSLVSETITKVGNDYFDSHGNIFVNSGVPTWKTGSLGLLE
jgi:hypothetical protein